MTRKIIIDCDPGQDDAINLFLSLTPNEAYKILGITVVAGNVPLEKTQRNARLICELVGRSDIPIYAGCDTPLELPLATAEDVHGREGLEGIDIYDPALALQDTHAVDFIVQTLRDAQEHEMTLVATGPLTNIATAMQSAPDILPKIKDIVIMGGAMREGGNITPSAEFNVFVDPHAAQIVFASGCRIIVFGLDVTHKVVTCDEVMARIKNIGNDVALAAHNLLTHYGRFDAEKFGTLGAPLHDPCTMAYILKPELFTFKSCNIRVETDSELCRGHTSVDFWNGTDLPKNSEWAYKVDRDGFFNLMISQFEKYSA